MMLSIVLLLLGQLSSACINLRVATAQFDSVPNLNVNVAKMINIIKQSSTDGAHVVAFFETALTSYNATYIQTLSRKQVSSAVTQLQHACFQHMIYCIVGTPWWTSEGVRQNAAIVINSDGSLIGHQPKTMLVGDDLSWASPGESIHTFNITVGNVSSGDDDLETFTASIIICHDVRFPELVRLPVLRGSRVIFYISWEQRFRCYRPGFIQHFIRGRIA